MVHDPAPPWVIWKTIFCPSVALVGLPMVAAGGDGDAEIVSERGVDGDRRRIGEGDDGGRHRARLSGRRGQGLGGETLREHGATRDSGRGQSEDLPAVHCPRITWAPHGSLPPTRARPATRGLSWTRLP